MKQVLIAICFLLSVSVYSQASDAALKKGMTKYDAKDYKGAMADFTKAITLNPKNVNALYYRGNCKQRLEDYRGAMADYTQAVKLKPTLSDAYTNRAHSKYMSLNLAGSPEDYKAVIADYSKAIELNPNDTVARLNRGSVKEFTKDYTGAIHDFTRLCEIIPKSGEAYYYKANAEDKAEQKEAACDDWNKAIELGETRAQPFIAKNCN